MALFNYKCDEVKRIIEEVSPNYPQLTTFEKEWLYFHKYGYIPGIPVELEYETINVNPTGMVSNAIPYQYKSAILKGNTDENLQSVKMPVLRTTNEDGTKSNILTVNEEVELRGIGEVQDELNLLTGELTQRIDEIVLDGSGETIYGHQTTDTETLRFFITCFGYDTNVNTNFPFLTNSNLPIRHVYDIDEEGMFSSWGGLFIRISKTKLMENSAKGLKNYLQSNPITIQYQLKTESIKTVDLTPLNIPYEGTNHYELTSNIPCEAILEVPVVSTGKQTLEEINN